MLTKITKIKLQIIFFIIIIIYFSIILFYFLTQSQLTIKNFENQNTLTTTQKTFIFQGKATNIKSFKINNKEIYLDENKNFKKKIYLFPHQNKFIFQTLSKTDELKIRHIFIYLK